MNFLHRLKTLYIIQIGLGMLAIALYLDQSVVDRHFFTKLIGEVGALFLVVGTLHWMFEYQIRQAMLKDIFDTILAGHRIIENGLIDCHADSNNVDNSKEEIIHWKESDRLVIAVHYSEGFFRALAPVLRQRCQEKKQTQVILSDPTSAGITYLRSVDKEVPEVEPIIGRIKELLTNPNHPEHLCQTRDDIGIFLHHYVLRYVLVATEEHIWISLLLNSKGISPVPAFKIKADSPLYKLLWEDIQRLKEQSTQYVPESGG